MDNFCNLDMEDETLGSVKYKRERVVALLRSHKIGENSSFYVNTNNSFAKYEAHFSQQNSIRPIVSRDPTAGTKRKYIGKLKTESEEYTIRTKVYNNHFILIRTYYYDAKYIQNPKETLDVSWKFSPSGRISQINTILHPTREEPYDIVKVVQHSLLLQEQWTRGEAKYNQIPSEVKAIHPSMPSASFINQYRFLFRIGHELARDITEKALNIKQVDEKEEPYKDLSEIIYETKAFDWIRKAANLHPRVNPSNKKKKLLINY